MCDVQSIFSLFACHSDTVPEELDDDSYVCDQMSDTAKIISGIVIALLLATVVALTAPIVVSVVAAVCLVSGAAIFAAFRLGLFRCESLEKNNEDVKEALVIN